ncbi:MAG: acyl carrier protein [Rudaea sp.]
MHKDLDTSRIAATVKNFLHERFDLPLEQLTDESSLRDFGLDSILMLDVMLDVEDRLGVTLKDLSMPPNPKLKDVFALIGRNLAVNS